MQTEEKGLNDQNIFRHTPLFSMSC